MIYVALYVILGIIYHGFQHAAILRAHKRYWGVELRWESLLISIYWPYALIHNAVKGLWPVLFGSGWKL